MRVFGSIRKSISAWGLREKLPKWMQKKWFIIPFFILISVVLLAAFWTLVLNPLIHKDKTYSNLYVAGIQVGGLTSEQLATTLESALKDVDVEFRYDNQSEVIEVSDTGVYIDHDELKKFAEDKPYIEAFRPWFVRHDKFLPLLYSEDDMAKVLEVFTHPDFDPPTSASFKLEDDELQVVEATFGYGIDPAGTGERLVGQLAEDLSSTVQNLEITNVPPSVSDQDVANKLDDLKNQLDTKYALTTPDGEVVVSKDDIASWLSVERNDKGEIVIEVDGDSIKEFVEETANAYNLEPVDEVTNTFKSGRAATKVTTGVEGRQVTNVSEVAKGLVEHIDNADEYTGELKYRAIPYKEVTSEIDDTLRQVYTYHIEVWGNVGASTASFRQQVAETLNHPRGWAAAGIGFQEVSSGGGFSIVLAEPSRVAAASSGCSAEWSCRVGRNVIINDLRWREATPAWNAAGGGIRDYRHMVVNHEAGHWLGFGHLHCGGPGQIAPVMLQQSINLHGCKFNPWPTALEISMLQ